MSEKREPPAGKAAQQAQRDKRLAEALRANLKRRKAAKAAAEPGKPSPK